LTAIAAGFAGNWQEKTDHADARGNTDRDDFSASGEAPTGVGGAEIQGRGREFAGRQPCLASVIFVTVSTKPNQRRSTKAAIGSAWIITYLRRSVISSSSHSHAVS
jgi:hypothetical protein